MSPVLLEPRLTILWSRVKTENLLKMQNRSVWEMLWADDLVIIAISLKELEDSYCAWKTVLKARVLE